MDAILKEKKLQQVKRSKNNHTMGTISNKYELQRLLKIGLTTLDERRKRGDNNCVAGRVKLAIILNKRITKGYNKKKRR